MEEEMRQGVMGADVQSPANNKSMQIEISINEVADNLKNLSEEEKQLITQLNVPQFRSFMSKIFGNEFGRLMEVSIPKPQVSQPSESPAPTQGQGMMTQPPSA
jgi:hypothetical protein